MPSDDAAREVSDWPNLADRLTAHPLPTGAEDCNLSVTQLAQVFSVTTNAVKKWLDRPDDPLPYAVRGAPGREYEIPLSWAHAWRAADKAAEDDARATIARNQAAFMGVEAPAAAPGRTLGAREVREMSQAALVHAQAERQRGRLTPLVDVYDLLETLMIDFRNATIGLADRLERELSLTPAQVRQTERALDETLEALAEKIAESRIGADYAANPDMDPQLQLAQ